MDERFPKQVRVRKQSDFDAVYQASIFAADNLLVMQVQRNGLNVTRLGLSVGKKVGDAPTRNKWKRTIREVFRKCRHELPSGLDLVVRPRKGAVLSYAELQRAFPKLVKRVVKKLPPKGTE